MDRQEQAESGVRDVSGRWVKGRSGNPGGRPKSPSVLAEIERQLELESDDGRPQRVRLVEKLIQMARGGDMKAMDLVLKRVAPERLAVDVDHNLPLVVIRDYTGVGGQLNGERPAIDARVTESPRPGPRRALEAG